MSNKNITFNTDAGVPAAANLVINTGSSFETTFTVVDTSNTAFDFTGYTGSAQLAKSVAIGSSQHAIKTFEVGFTSAKGGEFRLSLGSTATRTLSEGRYVYDVLIGSGSSVYRIVSGDVLVIAGISSAPS